MLRKLLLLAAAFSAAVADVQYADRNCGNGKPPCSEDMKCVADDPSCTDLTCCRGYCYFKNEYKSCGGLRPEPVYCDDGTECIDDLRIRGSCGMACDAPGICAPKELKPCGGFAGFSCPEGLYCYYPENGPCDPMKGGRDCLGVCL